MATQKKRAAVPPLSDEAIAERVRHALSAGAGLTSTELAKSLSGKDKVRAADQARALSARGELVEVVKGKTIRFFAADPIATLDRLVPELIADEALDASQLKTAVRRRAPGHDALLAEWLKRALSRGIVHLHAPRPRARSKRYAREPDLRLLLKKPLEVLRKSLGPLERLGIARERVLELLRQELGLSASTPSPPPGISRDRREVFLAALDQTAAQHPRGALLPLRELRARARLDKSDFDATALDLSREGLLVLHHHDHPGSLSEAEQHALVRDASGTHYVGVARRAAP